MLIPLVVVSLLALLLNGAIFGFFYAWVCSTMWGLDAADPALAIGAMQAMNASVRNAVFFPAFFLTPAITGMACVLSLGQRRGWSALLFGAAAVLYLIGGLGLTIAVNIPMNEALALVVIPSDTIEAQKIWQDYSRPWQVWNTVRAVVCGVCVLLVGAALFTLRPAARTSNQMSRANRPG